MKVYYMNGAGNDFMVLDARENENRDFSALAKEYCAITGADGFMAVGKSERPTSGCIFTMPMAPGAKCAATVPDASAGLPMIWGLLRRK